MNCRMYNAFMANTSYEIRVCASCGLRYPLVEGHLFGMRCPVCMGETRVTHRWQVSDEFETRRPRVEVDAERNGERGKRRAALLDNIRSAWNVGSILRSADGFGFSHAYLCGITPAADNEAVAKTSLGAEQSVRWSYHKDAVRLVQELKSESWNVYALEGDQRAVPLTGVPFAWSREQNEVLIVGNEVSGVDPELLDLCDRVFYIPMQGEKKSFNVAIAFGIAAYALAAEQG